jgi:NTE family protein
MRRSLVVFLLLAVPCTLRAQQPAPQPAKEAAQPAARPKIGIALEGGGALGLAHIGVLEWLEQHHIPVDYIAGTSMGGLVGGFYASGKSPAELRKLVAELDWDATFGGEIPYSEISFRRKEDQRAYPNALLLRLRSGVTLPAGLNTGQQIGLLIEKETLPYSNVKNFDALPIPFRCVATDLVSGKQVTFRDGPLAEALRATISLPGVFNPVRLGEHVYVDGGLLDNLPTDAVRQMGADIVIAVHLQKKKPDAESIQSLFEVLDRSIDVVLNENELRGLANADLVISVDLAGYSSSEFNRHEAIIAKGLEAAQEKSRLLAPYALDDAAWAEYLRERAARQRHTVPVPQFVEVHGADADTKKNIESLLARYQGHPLDTKKLEADLTQLTGMGRFDQAGYRMTTSEGRDGLLIDVHQKGFTTRTLQPGFELEGSETGEANFTLGARLTFLDVGGYRSEWRTDFLFGSQYSVHTEYFHPFTAASKWFLAPEIGAGNSAYKIYEKNDPLAEYRVNRAEMGADLGYAFDRFSELRVGYEAGYYSNKLRIGAPLLPTLNGAWSAARLRYRTDWTDDPEIPRRGLRIESNFHWYAKSPGASEAFPVLELRTGYFQPVSRANSFFLLSSGGTTFGLQQTGLPQFTLGGPERLGAYGMNELRGNQYFLFQGGYLRNLMDLPPFFGKKIYFTAQYEIGKMYGAANPGTTAARLPDDFSGGILVQTAFGPIFLGGSVGDSGHQKWFFRLGRVF